MVEYPKLQLMVDAECLADSKSTRISEIGAKLRTHEAFENRGFFSLMCRIKSTLETLKASDEVISAKAEI